MKKGCEVRPRPIPAWVPRKSEGLTAELIVLQDASGVAEEAAVELPEADSVAARL